MNRTRLFKKAVNLWVLISFLFWSLAGAAPENGQVVAGSAAISQAGSQTTINQASQHAVINWQGFDTTSAESVRFNQPNVSSIALNRITSGLPTTFAGSLSANGQVWIVNPAGVLFTSTSQIDVAGLLATTHGISNANFMAGNYQFNLASGFENAKIINNGLISVKDLGIVGLVAPGVENNGVIQAHLGKVVLASGSAFVLDLYGDQLINFGSNPQVQSGYVSNAGLIKADGGKVLLTARSAGQLVENVISMSGTIEAKTASIGKKGEIILQGYHSGKVTVKGKLDVSDGGFVETSGADLDINDATIIAGVGGEWLIDPSNITINASSTTNEGTSGVNPIVYDPTTGATTSTILNTTINSILSSGTSVTINTTNTGLPGSGAGNITISAPITHVQAAGVTPTLTLNAGSTGTISFSGTGNIISSGAIGLNVVFNALPAIGGAITITGGITTNGGNFTATNVAGNIAVNGPVNAGAGNVSLTAGAAAISQTAAGVITANTLTTSSKTGTVLNAVASAVSNFNATNTTTSGAISFTNSGALNITGINQSVAAGALTITNTTGAISQSGGIISVTGASSFNSGANPITLNSNNALTGAVTLTSSNAVQINNDIALSLAASVISGGGTLTATTTNDAITQTGVLTVTGVSSFNAGTAVITLGSANVLTGAVTLTSSNNVSLTNSIALSLAASTIGGNLIIATSNDAISQTGLLTVGGNSSFTAGTNSITLGSNNLFTGTVAVVSASNVNIKNDIDLKFAASTMTGTLTATTTDDPITQTGVLTVTGVSSFNVGNNIIDLSTSNNAFTGAVSLNNTGSNNVSLANNIALSLGASSIGGNLTVATTNDAISQAVLGVLSVGGSSSFTAGAAAITLNRANLFTGPVSFSNTGLNAVSITNAQNLTLGTSSTGGALTVTTAAANGAISQSGILTVTGASSFSSGTNAITLTSANLFTGAVTLTSSNAVQINNDINLLLGASVITGSGTLTATTTNDAITQTGILTVAGVSSFNAGTAIITLGSANVLTGAVTLTSTNNVSLTNSIALSLAASTIGGNLIIATSNDAVSQAGLLTVGGNSSFTAGTNSITLGSNNLFTGTVTVVSASNVNIKNDIDLKFAASTMTGTLTATTTDDPITQTGILTVTGVSSFNAGNNIIDLSTSNNAFTGAVSLNNTGSNNVSLTNNIALSLGASSIGGNLTVATTNDAISQAVLGVLSVGGSSSFTAGAAAITVNRANLFTGPVSFSNTGANAVALTNAQDLNLGASTIGGAFTVTTAAANGAISQSGILTVTGASSFSSGTNAITLTSANLFTGAVALTSGNIVQINNDINLSLGVSTIGGNLTVTTTNDAITQTGILTVADVSSFNAGTAVITLGSANVLTGAVTLTSSNNVSLTNSIALSLAASTIGGNLIVVTSSDAISQTGILTVGGTSSFNAVGNTITLNGANLFTGAVSLLNTGVNAVSITNVINLILGTSTIGGSLTASTSATNNSITQTGILTVTGASNFNAGSNLINLSTSNNAFTGAVVLNSGSNASINNNLNLILAASTIGGNLTATTVPASNRSITQTGVLNVTGLSNFSVGGNVITLNSANLFTGAVSFSNTGANAVSIRNAQNLTLGASSTGGALTVTTAAANGAISQSGILTVTGASSFNAGTNTITLTSANLFTGAVALISANNVQVNNDINLSLGVSTIGGNLTVTTTNDAITQTGIVTVTGLSSFNAGTAVITLGSANVLTGAVTLTSSNNVSLTNSIALSLAASTIGGNLIIVTSSDAISQTGLLTVGGTSSFNAVGNTITLNSANLFTGAVSLLNTGAANAVSITNALNLILGTSTIGGTLTASTSATNNSITQTGILTVAGISSFSAGANLINLSTSNNAFTGAVSLSNSGLNNVSLANNITLVLGASTVGNNLTVTTTNDSITQTGALVVPGMANFNSGANTLNLLTNGGSNNFSGVVSLSNSGAFDISIRNNANLLLGAVTSGRDLFVTANGSITQSGATVITARDATFTAGANAITLTNNNNFTRNVGLSNSGAFDVMINDVDALAFAASTIGNNLTVTANGAITQVGVISVGNTSDFSTSAGVITLNSANVFAGAVTLTGLSNVSLTNSIALILAASMIGGNLTVVTSSDAISQTGILTVGGNSSFTASANSITLTDANLFTGTVAFSNSGAANNVTLNNAIATLLSASTVGGVLTITSGGDITVNGILTSAATAGSKSIVLSSPNFINNVGAGALVPGAGNFFLVYANDPSASVFNGLVSGNQAIWNQTIGSLPPGSTPAGSRYIFSFQPSVTLTTTGAVKNYGDDLTTTVGTFFTTTPFVDASLYGNVFTQDTPANALATFAPTSAGASPTATVAGSPYAVTSAATATTGYLLTVNNSGTIVVNQAPLTITANNQIKTYGQTITFLGTEFNSSGLQNGESIGSVTLNSLGEPGTAGVASSPYAINTSAATGGTFDPANYSINYSIAGTITVNQAPLTITANNQIKTYGQTFTFLGSEFSSIGLQNGESIGSVTLLSSGTSPTANVAGSPYLITPSAAIGGTFDINNYSVTYNDGQLSVGQAALSITANNQSKTYGQTFTFLGTEFSSIGLQNGESIGSVTLLSSGTSPTVNVAGSPYLITPSAATGGSFDINNYAVTYNDGELVVNQAALTITANNQIKTYGQTITFLGTEFNSSGLQNGETIGSVALTSLGEPGTAGVASSPYAINTSAATGGTFDPNNYVITYSSLGTITVNAATLIITAINQSKIYGQIFIFLGNEFSSVGLQNGESIGSVNLNSAGASQSATVEGSPYLITGSSATGGTFDPANYSITYNNGLFIVHPVFSAETFSRIPNVMTIPKTSSNGLLYSDANNIIVVGEVTHITGTVVQVNEKGAIRVLAVGDHIYLGDKVIAEKGGSVDIRIFTNEIVHVVADKPHTF